MSSTKQELSNLLGPSPDKVPLEAVILEAIDCGMFIREKVEYNVEEKERIRAYILIPKKITEKTPAIFCHHQHAGNYALGKSEVVGLNGEPDQAYARELAKLGFITFAPDAIAFEERNWNKTPGKAGYFEMASRLVKGETLLAKVLHDASVGIDYLCSRDEVDENKIGFIGHSYGGRMAIWAPVFEKRIKASVSHCGCINYKDSLTHDTGIQMEFCVPEILKWGDIEDVVKLVEPSSLLISATDNDKWSKGAEKIYKQALPVFIKGELQLKVYEGGHIFTNEMREYAYKFLKEHV
jgi:dienelactone hydrolase